MSPDASSIVQQEKWRLLGAHGFVDVGAVQKAVVEHGNERLFTRDEVAVEIYEHEKK